MSILDFSDQELIKAIHNGNSLRTVCKNLHLSGTQSQYRRLRKIIEKYDIDVSHHRTVSSTPHYKWQNTLENIDQHFLDKCTCWKDIPVRLGLHEADKDLKSRYYTFLKDFIKQKGFTVSHFTFNKGGNSKKRYGDKALFIKGSNVTKQTVKKRYLKYRESLGIKYQCDMIDCSLSKWKNKELNLQLDHINGINNDDRIENLRLLCPNCHSQTDTFAGRKRL